ncbi:hypothetical protein Clacol_001026 [Clathrus columnatus]|uniref:Ferric reductase NAD binding domain-containing protein n=1 Tax=Clathrus columnatus TaxID=1419009 RepID=A0AAV5A1E9_9AGAM|nr:hypothetical protein Clacol_001026 [Clathrus columnatus]
MTRFISSGTPPVLNTASPSGLWWESSVVVGSNSKPPTVTTNNVYTPKKSTVSPKSAGRAKLLQVNHSLPADKHAHTFFKPLDPHRHTRFDMDEIEAEDVPLVSELAQTGRPNIDQVVVEEASRSHKSMVVACCGPTTLNAVVRKSVAKQIKPRSIMKWQSPAIDLVSEDFEW